MKYYIPMIALLLAGSILAQDFQALTPADFKMFTQSFHKDSANRARQNALADNSISSLAVNRALRVKQQHFFSDKIDVKGISNQKGSGRCWLFAGLNILRPGVIDRYDLKNFEFSQNYLFFYDKMEKANFFLNQI